MNSSFRFRVCNFRALNSIALQILLLLSVMLNSTAGQPSVNNPPDPYSYAKFTPLMAIIIVVLISALFFMGFFSIYIRHCANANNAGSIHTRGSLRGRRAAAARGLDAAVIETFPLLDYSEVKNLKIGDRTLECAVCLCEFEDEETLRLIPKCDHVFHPECIDAWFASHTTCPVCRANLAPEAADSQPSQATESGNNELDIEAQNSEAESGPLHDVEGESSGQVAAPEAQVIDMSKILNRNRTRRSRSGRPRKFPRSHSTGHSLIQPGEDTERFTLRLPADVRKQVVNRELHRTRSLLLPTEGSTRRGYRSGGGDGSSRGKLSGNKKLEPLDRVGTRSDRWVLTKTLSFFSRSSPRVVADDGEGTSTRPNATGPTAGESVRPPV